MLDIDHPPDPLPLQEWGIKGQRPLAAGHEAVPIRLPVTTCHNACQAPAPSIWRRGTRGRTGHPSGRTSGRSGAGSRRGPVNVRADSLTLAQSKLERGGNFGIGTIRGSVPTGRNEGPDDNKGWLLPGRHAKWRGWPDLTTRSPPRAEHLECAPTP